MKKLVFAIAVLIAVWGWLYFRQNTGAATTGYDEYGVWEAVSGRVLKTNQAVSAGPADVSRLDREINFHIYGTGPESLNVRLKVYGMMSHSRIDTSKAALIATFTEKAGDSTIVFADTLEAGSDYPYIYTRLESISTATTNSTFSMWSHSRPIEKTVIRTR